MAGKATEGKALTTTVVFSREKARTNDRSFDGGNVFGRVCGHVHAHVDCRCNVRTGSPIRAVTSIACTLMVMIYARGNLSGANFNLAVSLLLAIAGKDNMQRWASTWLVKL